MTGITRRTLLLGIAAGLAATTTGCMRTAPIAGLSMACGESGGIYLEFGKLLRDALSRTGDGALELRETNGSVDNLALLVAGEVELAIALADAARELGGAEVAIGRVYQNYLQCVVRADGPVHALDDLDGRPISIGAPGSGSSLTTRRLLEATGRTSGSRAPLVNEYPLDDGLHALAEGGIDALFWSGGIPTPKIDELAASLPLALIDLSAGIAALDAIHPDQYRSTRVPVGVYGTATATPTIGVSNLLLASPDLPGEVARVLVDVLIEDARSLVPSGTVGVQFLTPANLIDTGVVPLHPAAQRRYRERYG